MERTYNIEDSIRPLADQAADIIIQYIIDKDLQAGDRLPNEYELIELLHVGRSSVREAIKALASRNILEVRRGSGTYVCERCGVVEDPLGFMFVRDKLKLTQDLFEVRYILEPEIAAMAANRATQEDIEELEVLCAEMERQVRAGELHEAVDFEFHARIAKSSGNLALRNLLPIINQSIHLHIDPENFKLKDETIEVHWEITNAIKCHDAVGARDAMIVHMIYNRRNIKAKMRETGHKNVSLL